MGDDARYLRRRQGVFGRRIDDTTIILDSDAATYFALNAAGSVLWERLEFETGGTELAELLVAEFGLTSERAEADASAFLEQLRHLDLLEEPC